GSNAEATQWPYESGTVHCGSGRGYRPPDLQADGPRRHGQNRGRTSEGATPPVPESSEMTGAERFLLRVVGGPFSCHPSLLSEPSPGGCTDVVDRLLAADRDRLHAPG